MAPRNLFIIVADTLRDPTPLGTPGAPLMPFLESFARQGRPLEHLFASSSWTAPSHVALLTGSDPWKTHFFIPGSGKRPPPSQSIADQWRAAGGMAVAFSANFLVSPVLGTATGYGRFNPGFPAGLAGLAQLAATQLGYERSLYNAMRGELAAGAGPIRRAYGAGARWAGTGLYKSINSMRSGEAVLKALGKFTRRRADVAEKKPLHIFFNIADAHEPYLVGQNGGAAGTAPTMGHAPSINFVRFTDLLAERGSPEAFAEAYKQSCRTVDDLLRRLIEHLRSRGLLENAVVCFLSDHGQNLGEHRFYGHGVYLYDELLKIPSCLWEFADGKPVPPGPPPEEWFDHRHLFDLLSSYKADGGSVDVRETLESSLVRRGPAASYYEGPSPRPPDGLVVKAPKPALFRMVRIQQGRETAMLRSDTKGGNLTPADPDSRDTHSDALAEIAQQILAHEIGQNQPTGPGGAEMDAKVDARLKSWGYD